MSSHELLKQQNIAELSSIDFQIDDLVSRVISTAKSLEEIGLEASSFFRLLRYFSGRSKVGLSSIAVLAPMIIASASLRSCIILSWSA